MKLIKLTYLQQNLCYKWYFSYVLWKLYLSKNYINWFTFDQLKTHNSNNHNLNSLNAKVVIIIESSQLICSANQLTGFYMMAVLAFNELKKIIKKQLKIINTFYKKSTNRNTSHLNISELKEHEKNYIIYIIG